MIQIILLLLTGIVLSYAAYHDIKHREITLYTLLSIASIGFFFFICTKTPLINLIYAEIIITMIFLIPTISGMGLGDMLLFWSLGFYFINTELLNIFLISLFISAIILTLYYIFKEDMLRKKNKFKDFYFPLIPAILTGFFIYFIYFLI